MKRLACTLALLAAASLSISAQQGPLPVRPEQLPKAAPLAFTPPTLLRESLPNGMSLILLPDHSLPLVKLYAIVKVGGIYEPAGKTGLAELTGAALKAGGTAKYPADAMEQTLESIAAELSTSIGEEYGEVRLNLLSRDLGTALPIFADVLMEPAFAQDKLEIEKSRMEEEIRRQNEDPWEVAFREMKKALYGDQSPWARTPTIQSVEGLTREDCVAFHRRYFHPNDTILAVAGDFDPKAMAVDLQRLFEGWKPERVEYPPVAPAPERPAPGVLLMDKPDLTQTTVLAGELTGRRGRGVAFNRDVYAMDVMNFILGGGGFTSTLTREIRSSRGLAYTAGSMNSFDTDRGFFVAYCQTGVKTTAEACGLIRKAVAEATEAPPSAQELEIAKSSLLNKFVFNYQNSGQIVYRAALQDFFGYPEDYMATYGPRIRAVTARDCLAVARKYLHPGDFTYFVLGPAKELEPSLKPFGAITVKPLPEP
ncbi:MAG: M16 family metallopeptidase [Acidobacteriota bacterium]